MKQYKIQNRSQKNSQSCVPLKEDDPISIQFSLRPTIRLSNTDIKNLLFARHCFLVILLFGVFTIQIIFLNNGVYECRRYKLHKSNFIMKLFTKIHIPRIIC